MERERGGEMKADIARGEAVPHSLNFWRRNCSELSPCIITKMSSEVPLADQYHTEPCIYIAPRQQYIPYYLNYWNTRVKDGCVAHVQRVIIT